MTDSLSRERRSWNMSRIRSKNTRPELVVRSLLHRMGYRFRLHQKGMPGRPDIVLPKYQTVVFVHGCYWHRHPGCRFAYTPKSREEFWQHKFRKNVARDKANRTDLAALGWNVVIVWECETRELDVLARKVNEQMLAADRAGAGTHE